MKSLVEEAATIVKALEKAWTRAGKPQTFSVKIFEEEETNFFGFTKKSAKVGIFFDEKEQVVSANTEEKKSFTQNQNHQKKRPHQFNKNKERRDNSTANDRSQQKHNNDKRKQSNHPRPQHSSPKENNRDFKKQDHVVQQAKPVEVPQQPHETSVASKPTLPLPPQRKVLKISGRCYSGQKKQND